MYIIKQPERPDTAETADRGFPGSASFNAQPAGMTDRDRRRWRLLHCKLAGRRGRPACQSARPRANHTAGVVYRASEFAAPRGRRQAAKTQAGSARGASGSAPGSQNSGWQRDCAYQLPRTGRIPHDPPRWQLEDGKFGPQATVNRERDYPHVQFSGVFSLQAVHGQPGGLSLSDSMWLRTGGVK
jgi:hypothetical protein